MRRSIIVTLLLYTVAAIPQLSAQVTTGRAVLQGTVRDSANNRSVNRAQVCAVLPTGPAADLIRCTTVDSTASYRLDSLPAGKWIFVAGCETMGSFGRALRSDSIVVADSAPVRRDWLVTPTGCDPRPLRRVVGTFRGHYTPGFESSAFVPCAADSWVLPGDSLRTRADDEPSAWATFGQGAVPPGYNSPPVPEDEFGYSRYYVQWRGTVVGPGHYGHLGVSPFEIRVESLLEMRAPQRHDCSPQ